MGLTLFPGLVRGLGFAPLHLNSSLGEPFAARIVLVSVRADAREALTVRIGDARLYRRFGLPRTPAAEAIDVAIAAVRAASGEVVLQLSSVQPIETPLLELLVVAETGRGRTVRRYTVFLSPAGWRPHVGTSVPDGRAEDAAAAAAAVRDSGQRGARGAAKPDDPPHAGPGGSADSGQAAVAVERGDTLWEIAMARHYPGVSVYQMALAIYRRNPRAFGGGMARLRAGSTLVMPTLDHARTVDPSAARAMIASARDARLDRLVAAAEQSRNSPSGPNAGRGAGDAAAGHGVGGRLRLVPAAEVAWQHARSPAGSGMGNGQTPVAAAAGVIGSGFGLLAIPTAFPGDSARSGRRAAEGSRRARIAEDGSSGLFGGHLAMAPAHFPAKQPATANDARPAREAGRVASAGGSAAGDEQDTSGGKLGATAQASVDRTATPQRQSGPGGTPASDGARPETEDGAPALNGQARPSPVQRTPETFFAGWPVQVLFWAVAVLCLLLAAWLWLQPRRAKAGASDNAGDWRQ